MTHPPRARGQRIPRWALRQAAERLTREHGWWSTGQLAGELGCSVRSAYQFIADTWCIETKGENAATRHRVKDCVLLDGWKRARKRQENAEQEAGKVAE